MLTDVQEIITEPALDRKVRLQPVLAALFEELSGIATGPESYETSFLELGFDSLFLTQVTQALQRRFKVKVTFRQIVEKFSSIQALAAHLDSVLPAEAFAVEKPAAPAAAVRTAAAIAPAVSAAPAGSPLEELLKAQMQAMASLFEQQLAMVRGATPQAPAPAKPAAPIVASAATNGAAPAAAANGAASEEIKTHGPFKPVRPGSQDGLTEQQREYIQELIARYTNRTGKSKEYTQAHRAHLADPRAVAGFRSMWKEMVYPLVTDRSKGSRI